MQGESILEKAGESCSYLALVGWVVGCWKLTGGGRCDWIGLLHGEPSNGFPPGRPGCELMNHMLYVYIYLRIHLTTSKMESKRVFTWLKFFFHDLVYAKNSQLL